MLAKHLRIPIQQYVGLGAPRPQRTIREDFFSIRVYASTLPYARIGVVVGKSVDKRATARNRIRRTIMDAVQKRITTLPVADYLVMVNPAAQKMTRTEVTTATKNILKSP